MIYDRLPAYFPRLIPLFPLDSSQLFYAGKNVFPFNSKIESLDGKFQHDISQIPIELAEFSQIDEKFELIRAGDEHFVVLNVDRSKLFGWGFNSHHQLATIDSYKVLFAPDVIFETEDGEPIKFVECGKLSTCVVTGTSINIGLEFLRAEYFLNKLDYT